ncbi:Protein CBG26757 [Caenorhabditis briggsae]|uniref:Protein CBG26757 n=1 Tax=Caenorhabditis briggsae TaxID=6238 RepID=B6IED2_CAEBR|nr:Protein CBG26757 [Caenorhabditis briggsae]CAS01196.1 Protein CBG26757 [Caenorhabditis briggsae]
MKGADTVMSGMVQYNDWLDEECSNMAREGLRTLVVARKPLSPAELEAFDRAYHAAKMSISDRSQNMANVVNRMLERDLQLLCLTGVEDRLQSSLNSRGFYILVFSVQFLVLLICIAYCNVIMGGTIQSFVTAIGQSFVDAFTLKQIRNFVEERKVRTQQRQAVPDEPMTERGGASDEPGTSNTVDA